MPAHAWVVDQGALGDSMYYVVSGRLKEMFLSSAAPVGFGQEYTHGDSFGEVCLLETDHENPATVECMEAAILYRLRRDAFKNILPRFPGWYESLFKLSYKRVAEYDRTMRLRRNMLSGTKDQRLPARWPQLSGSMYQEAHSRTLKAGSRRETSLGPERQLEAGRSALAGIASSWNGARLELATATSQRAEVLQTRTDDWWKDRDPDLGGMGLFGQAATRAEKIDAVHRRASSLAWRKDALRMAGQAVIEKIK